VSLRRAVELALDASRGLAYMHSKKPSPIVHRDLKPANLMIAGNLYQVSRPTQASCCITEALQTTLRMRDRVAWSAVKPLTCARSLRILSRTSVSPHEARPCMMLRGKVIRSL